MNDKMIVCRIPHFFGERAVRRKSAAPARALVGIRAAAQNARTPSICSIYVVVREWGKWWSVITEA